MVIKKIELCPIRIILVQGLEHNLFLKCFLGYKVIILNVLNV